MPDDGPGLARRILMVIGKLLLVAFLAGIGMGVVHQLVTAGYAALAGGEEPPPMVGALAALIPFVALSAWVSWLLFRAPRPEPAPARPAQEGSRTADLECPPLVNVKPRCAGVTVEDALYGFEETCSEENFQSLEIKEQIRGAATIPHPSALIPAPDGLLVRYEVRWKYSVFDDDVSGFHTSWALLAPADPAAGDPPEARYRVIAATAQHHMPDKFR